MKERVVEILVFLMTELRDDKQLHDIDLAPLRDRGYTTSEISAAFSWLYETMGAGDAEATSHARAARGSRRIFHEVERSVLSREAQGYLIQLAELGWPFGHEQHLRSGAHFAGPTRRSSPASR